MWFLVAIMTMVYDGDAKDVFVWSDPVFQSSEECAVFVKEQPQDIYFVLKREFPADKLDRLFCVEEEQLKKFFGSITRGESI